ncbi:MAG: Rap1a/Tai family immunity protein [Bdellovibrio bacteriovorus]
MRSPQRALSLAGALLAAASVSSAALAVEDSNFSFKTTKDLYEICSVEGEGEGAVQAQLACRAFIAATVQYHDAVSDRKKMKRLICYSPSATLEDGRTAFVGWAKRNAGDAKRMGEPPVVGLVRALAESSPCK